MPKRIPIKRCNQRTLPFRQPLPSSLLRIGSAHPKHAASTPILYKHRPKHAYMSIIDLMEYFFLATRIDGRLTRHPRVA